MLMQLIRAYKKWLIMRRFLAALSPEIEEFYERWGEFKTHGLFKEVRYIVWHVDECHHKDAEEKAAPI